MAPRRFSATSGIALVTTLVSLFVLFTHREGLAAVVGGFIPLRWTSVVDTGGLFMVPALLTPLSAALLHAGLFHLGMNLIMLVYTGRETEKALGPWGLLILYLVGAYAAAGAQWLAGPHSDIPMIGASGAASAIVGAYSLLYGRSRAKAIGPIPARVVHVAWLAAAWVVINLMTGLAFQAADIGIAAAAHIGGFIAGLILARPLFAWNWRKA